MHNRESVDPELDIIADILGFLSRSIDIALAAGIERRRLSIDPGFGFGKTKAQNLELVRRLRELTVLGCPILLGVSRKSTFGAVTGKKVPAERMVASIAAGVLGVVNGAAILRVHDVAAHVEAVQVLDAIGIAPPISSVS
jgi:dihydropteroate synthase